MGNRWFGLGLIALGALLLLGRVLNVDLGQLGWPLFVIVPGAGLLAAAFLGPREASGLAVPGSIVTTVGLILLIQSFTGTFHTWAYAWGLVLASVGGGIFLSGQLGGAEDENEGEEGIRLVLLGLVLFVAFGVMFEGFIFDGWAVRGAGRFLVPAAIIAAGVLLLRRNRDGEEP